MISLGINIEVRGHSCDWIAVVRASNIAVLLGLRHGYVILDGVDYVPAKEIYVVAATNGRKVEYWAAAVPLGEAASAVQELLEPGWRATLTERHLSKGRAGHLKMRSNDVRKL